MLMRNLFIVFFILAFWGCSKKNSTKIPNYLDKEISFNLVDSLMVYGDSTILMSPYLYPIKNNSKQLIAYDILTNNLVFYNKMDFRSQVIDLKSKFQMYSSLASNLFGVVEADNKFIVCSDPYFLITDSALNIIKEYKVDFSENSIKYYRIGDVTNIKFNESLTSVYFPVSPGLPEKDINAFYKGRIMEVNLNDGRSRILPIKLPFDYNEGTVYKLFALPNFTILKDKIYYIFPGSNYLYQYDLKSTKLDSVYISPKNVTINVKEVGNSMEDLVYSYLECNNFYNITSNDNLLLLFYFEGKRRKTYNRQKGLDELDCYVMGYNPEKNTVLFDTELNIKNILKKPYVFYRNTLYFISNQESVYRSNIQSKFLKYEMEAN